MRDKIKQDEKKIRLDYLLKDKDRLIEKAKKSLPRRVCYLADRYRFKINQVTVRDQRSRWGSCSSGGNISINWRLILLPKRLQDYIILHELVHLKIPNHSKQFKKRLSLICPNWRKSAELVKKIKIS